jgi:hypothetical protein
VSGYFGGRGRGGGELGNGDVEVNERGTAIKPPSQADHLRPLNLRIDPALRAARPLEAAP